MARHLFGASLTDWTMSIDEGTRTVLVEPGAVVTFFSDQAKQQPVTDLLDLTNTPITSVTATDEGRIPQFQGPDGDPYGPGYLWASANGGPAQLIIATDLSDAVDEVHAIATQAQATADAALANSGGGGGTGGVSSVNGQTGSVVLDAGDVGAVAAGPGNDVDLEVDEQFLGVDIADATATSPNRLEFRFQGQRTGYHNEYGEVRSQAAKDSTVPLRVIAHSPGQSADLFQATDVSRNPLAGIRSDGRVYAPNIGGSRLFTSPTTPTSNPRFGDVWIDTSTQTVRYWNGSQWVVISGSGGSTGPATAPAFVAATSDSVTFSSITLTKPDGAATLLACLAWSSADAATAPAGWTLVDELIGSNGRSGVWVADGDVTELTWSWPGDVNVAGVVLGYEAAVVSQHKPLLDTDGDATHTAPALSVPAAPATVVRFWWDKSANMSQVNLPGGVTLRAQELMNKSGGAAVVGADAEQTATGTAPALDATFNQTANNAGGYTIALVSPEPAPQTVVTSVDGRTGDVTLSDLYLPATYVPPVLSVNGQTGNVVIPVGGGEAAQVAKIVAAADAPASIRTVAQYMCDGTADQVQINQAIADAQAEGGGIVQLTAGTYHLSAPVEIHGTLNEDDPRTVVLRGVGQYATTLDAGTGNGILLTDWAQCHIAELGIEISGAGSGIVAVGVLRAGADFRSFWNSSFTNLRITGGFDSSNTGWAMDMEVPFRSYFANIEIEGVRNGVRWVNNSDIQNAGDCTFTRSFIELVGNDGIGIHISSPTGNLNQNNFSMVELGANGTGCTGILIDGADGGASQRFWGANMEQFDTLINVDHGESCEFDLNFVTCRDGGTNNKAFVCGPESFNNIFRAKWVNVGSGDSLVLIEDNNTNDNAPNVFEQIRIENNTGGTVTATYEDVTVLRDIVAFNGGTIQADILAKPNPRIFVQSTQPAGARPGDLWFW